MIDLLKKLFGGEPENPDILKRGAYESLEELIEGLTNSAFASQLYLSLCGQSAASLGVDLQPTSDEVACFGTFCLAVNSTQYIRKSSFLGGNQPDSAGAKLFSDYLLEHLAQLLGPGHSTESYTFYLSVEIPNLSPESHPFVELASLQPNMEAFQTRFINYKFKVPAFASRLIRVIQASLPKTYTHKLFAADLLPTGRQLAEITADIAKERLS